MNKKIIILIIVIIAIILLAVFLGNRGSETPKEGRYDDFAKCLGNSGVRMYGTYWCSHCNNQKKMFGTSWDYVHYIECSLPGGIGETTACKEAGIEAYPTWEFQDGTRFEGELSLQEISQYSNCNFE